MVAVSGIGIAAVNTTPTSGTIPIADNNAPVVYVTGGQSINFNSYSSEPETTLITTDSNEFAVTGNDSASIRADDMEGTYTNTSAIDTNGEVMTINPGDKLPATVNDSVEEFDFRNSTADDGTVDFYYDTGSADGANISVNGLSAGAGVGAVDASSGELLDNAQADQNGRVTFDDLDGGEHNVTVQQAPQNLDIRDEQNPSTAVTNANVEIRFFVQGDSGATQTITRSTTSGQIDMTGLPANESFVVVVSADGWTDRQIFVDSLYEQQTVYLLNNSADQVDKTFQYTDYSGNFPQENTVLIFERAINGEFTAISGDVIGATGEYRVSLESGQRYQIRLLNRQTGQTRIQGPYTSSVSGAQEIEIFSDNEIDVSALGPILNYAPSTGAVRERETTFEVDITDRESAVNSATVTLYRRTNGQLTQLDQSTTNGAGTVTVTNNLSGYNQSTAVVEVEYQLADGTTDTAYRNYSIRQLYQNENSLLNVLSGISALIPSGNLGSFQTTAAVFASLLLAAGASTRVALSGDAFAVVMVGGLAGFSVIGWVSYGLVFAAGVGVGALVFIRRGL
jgi:hypothetical protein